MTNGLTKTARARNVPAIPGIPGLPGSDGFIVLAPSPPGKRYEKRTRWLNAQKTELETYFELVTVQVDTEWKYLALDFIEGGGGFVIQVVAGDTFIWGYAAKKGDKPTVFITEVATNFDLNPFPTNPPEDMVLVEVRYRSAAAAAGPGHYPPPAGCKFLKYEPPLYPNGFPQRRDGFRGALAGTFDYPLPEGGYETVRVPGTLSTTHVGGPATVLTTNEPIPQNRSRYVYSPHGIRFITVLPYAGTPSIPGVPGYTVYDTVREWDAGANSIATEDGDLHVTFNVPVSAGVKVGFFPDGDRAPANAEAMPNAFYVFSGTDGFQYAVIDNGRTVVPKGNQATAQTNYEIRRVGGVVSYYVDDELVYTSSVHSSGPLRVGTTMYRTGDMVL